MGFLSRAMRGLLLGVLVLVLVLVPARRRRTPPPSATLRGNRTPLGNHPPFQLIDHPLEVTGMWPPLGRCTDEDVSSSESSLPSDVIAFPSLVSAPDQHGAPRATTLGRTRG